MFRLHTKWKVVYFSTARRIDDLVNLWDNRIWHSAYHGRPVDQGNASSRSNLSVQNAEGLLSRLQITE